jgi:hypothetical protein
MMADNRLAVAVRVVGATGADAALVCAGAAVLWLNGGDTVVSGPLTGIAVFEFVSVALLLARRALMRPAITPRSASAVRAERRLGTADLLMLAGLIASWSLTHLYFLGWASTLASATLLLGTTFQLMVDVTTGRNERPRRADQAPTRHRFSSLEAHRLLGGLAGAAGLVLTTSIHRWQPAILNPLALLVATAMGLSVCAGYLIRRLRARAHQNRTV